MNKYGIENRWLHLLLLVVVCGSLAAVAPSGGAVPRASAASDVRWAFYVTYNPNSLASLRANADRLNYVSPWFYTADANGRLNGTPQPEVNRLLRDKGIKNLPMIKNTAIYLNFHDLLYDGGKRDGLIAQLRSAVAINGYDGITIDWESVSAGDEAGMTLFMSALYRAFKADNKLVAMAVPAKSRDVNTGWAGSYNYKNLSPWADYFVIMAYDQHYPGGAAGPIAPLPWLNDVATYAGATLGASKVVWGVGLYGYDWNTTVTPKRNAEPRTWSEALALAKQYNATVQYDAVNHAPYFVYSKDNQRHEIWFEDKRSFDMKLNMVQQRGFAGFGLWRLGQEDPSVWNSIGGVITPPVVIPPVIVIPPPAATTQCDPIAPFTSNANRFYFSQTGHSLGGGFLNYWLAHGGLAIFGYPLTEEFQEINPNDGKTYTVQYFERNRFEWHPENRGTDQEFQLGLLGVQFVSNRFFPLLDSFPNEPSRVFFKETEHGLQGGFLSAWQSKGGLSLFGYPMSDEHPETSLTDGKTYTVQYFERARFEYHPENEGSEYAVQLGLLGTWALQQQGCALGD